MAEMRERITEIREYRDTPPDGYGAEAGYQIVTDKQTITLAIDDESSCCETWGYLLSEDDAARFIGAELRGIRITDTNRSQRRFTTDWHDDDAEHLDAGNVMFVDIETDRGVLQFVAYNAHNGYYGHEARVSSTQLTHSEML